MAFRRKYYEEKTGEIANPSALKVTEPSKCRKAEDRRKTIRFKASDIPGFKSANLVGGPEVRLINISRRGALIESPELISLGSSVSLKIITTDGFHIVNGKIIGRTIHYRVSSMNNKSLQCQSAILFDKDFLILPALKM